MIDSDKHKNSPRENSCTVLVSLQDMNLHQVSESITVTYATLNSAFFNAIKTIDVFQLQAWLQLKDDQN